MAVVLNPTAREHLISRGPNQLFGKSLFRCLGGRVRRSSKSIDPSFPRRCVWLRLWPLHVGGEAPFHCFGLRTECVLGVEHCFVGAAEACYYLMALQLSPHKP